MCVLRCNGEPGARTAVVLNLATNLVQAKFQLLLNVKGMVAFSKYLDDRRR